MEPKPPSSLTRPTVRFPWRARGDDSLKIVVLFVLTRLILAGVGVQTWGVQLARSNWRGVDRAGIRYAVIADQPLLDMWARWDSWEYEEIAREGYWYDQEAKPRPYGTVACFPLYPLALRAVGLILGGRYVLAGLLISNVSAILGFVILFQWALWWGDRRAAWVTVSAAITFPAGLFWSALYPQSLFFAFSIASLILAFEGRLALGCLAGMLALSTRLEGVALIPALLAIQYQRRGWRLGREMLWLGLTPLGLLAYMGYLAWRWGDPLLFLKVHALFGRGLTNPFGTLIRPLGIPNSLYDPKIVGTYGVGLLLLLLGHPARLKWPILLYGWLMFLIPLSSGIYLSIYRVHLVNVTIYLAFGLGLGGRWRVLAWALVILGFYAQIVMMIQWARGYYVP